MPDTSVHMTKDGLEKLKRVKRKISANTDRDYTNEETILFLVGFYETEELPTVKEPM